MWAVIIRPRIINVDAEVTLLEDVEGTRPSAKKTGTNAAGVGPEGVGPTKVTLFGFIVRGGRL